MSINRHLGQVLRSGVLNGSGAPQGVHQPGIFDSVSNGCSQHPVANQDRQCSHGYRAEDGNDVEALKLCGQCDFHSSSLSTPPAENAAALSDGSAKAGPGACTQNPHLTRAVEAHQAFRDYLQSGMRSSADRQRARAMRAMWDYLESLP